MLLHNTLSLLVTTYDFISIAIDEIHFFPCGSGIIHVQVFPLSPNSQYNEVDWAS